MERATVTAVTGASLEGQGLAESTSAEQPK
jgi:hypothetical protein